MGADSLLSSLFSYGTGKVSYPLPPDPGSGMDITLPTANTNQNVADLYSARDESHALKTRVTIPVLMSDRLGSSLRLQDTYARREQDKVNWDKLLKPPAPIVLDVEGGDSTQRSLTDNASDAQVREELSREKLLSTVASLPQPSAAEESIKIDDFLKNAGGKPALQGISPDDFRPKTLYEVVAPAAAVVQQEIHNIANEYVIRAEMRNEVL